MDTFFIYILFIISLLKIFLIYSMDCLGTTAISYGITDIFIGITLKYLGITHSETKWYKIGTGIKK